MISEHQFANSYASVWRDVTPLSDGFWKYENLKTIRAMPPMTNAAPAALRGVVNELAFLAFSEIRSAGKASDRAHILRSVKQNISTAISYVNRQASGTAIRNSDITPDCISEAVELTIRLLDFFRGNGRIELRPKFQGCGIVSHCEGDVLYKDCLYEIKAGERLFRINDLRQLLVYSALAYSTRALSFERVGLMNPRTGLCWVSILDDVCLALAGQRASDTLTKLVDQFSAASTSR